MEELARDLLLAILAAALLLRSASHLLRIGARMLGEFLLDWLTEIAELRDAMTDVLTLVRRLVRIALAGRSRSADSHRRRTRSGNPVAAERSSNGGSLPTEE